ncbi:DUF5983 family protein [Phytohabitans aurantiacus]|uniref:DUF5983 domain-containing protein n=1 Tax=Phytohabitans aurantiacus TaxID=3016789 RepID=A0ABQ5RBN6_9ACTN|nr:hypothetical protein [Phytohabitans aurantiacus]GLI03006.1 hypothetical protein Pa4123_82840 [Phytohabitans aurantiacus]
MIRKLLYLSTAHLPEDLGAFGLDTAPDVVAYGTDTGWLLWVPDDPDVTRITTTDPAPRVVRAIQQYARRLGCDYVLFDVHADIVDGLQTWDW